MSKTMSLALAAGVTLGLAGSAMAQQVSSDDEVRAIVSEMLADAESRSSLLSGTSAGHDGGFFLQGDGYDLRISGGIQFRQYVNYNDKDAVDDYQRGFDLARTRLIFDGTVADDWNFHIQGNFATEGDFGAFELEDAEIHYDFGNGWTAGMGQFKSVYSRDFNVDGYHQLAVERSVLDRLFGAGRQQGVFLAIEDEDWRTRLSFNDGANSENTDFSSDGESDFAFTGRFEYKFFGTWDQFEDYSSRQGDDEGFLLGAGIHAQQRSTQGSQTGDFNDVDTTTVLYTVDASYEGDGWNATAGFYGAWNQSRAMGDDDDFSDFGVFVQAGVFVAENTELFGRWEGLFLDDSDPRNFSDDNYNWLTFGINQYYAGHAAKATADVVVALEESDELVGLGVLPNTNVGILGSPDSGEVALRLQFQLLF